MILITFNLLWLSNFAQTKEEIDRLKHSQQVFVNDLLHTAMNLISLYEDNEVENYSYFKSAEEIYQKILGNDSLNKNALYNLGAMSNNRLVYIQELLTNEKKMPRKEKKKLVDETERLASNAFKYLEKFDRYYGSENIDTN